MDKPATFEEIVRRVNGARPRVVDRWEACALIESFGYTDARVERELGFPDTLLLGEYVCTALSAERPAKERAAVKHPGADTPSTELARCLASSFVYAFPWLVTFAVERLYPDAFRVSGEASASLGVALMLSLMVGGGFVQAITRRGRFYLAIRQPRVAAAVCAYLFKVGLTVMIGVAVTGCAIGWYFSLFAWPALLLAADQFVLLGVLWMTCAILTVREQWWRVPIAFIAGGVAFVIFRAAGRGVPLSELLALCIACAAGLAQGRSVFGGGGRAAHQENHLPRLTLVLFGLLPFFWYGTLYFCFLFADRFAASASVAALTGAPFGLRPDYKLGMDIALMSFLFGAAGIEYGNLWFTRQLKEAARSEYAGAPHAISVSLSRTHLRATLLVGAIFLPIATAIAVTASRLWPAAPHAVWTTFAIGETGYLLLSIGLLNALILFTFGQPWPAVRALAAALAMNVTLGFILSHVFDTYFAVIGLIGGAVLLAVLSTRALRQAFDRADYAIAAA